eukprot:g10630.t1
MTTTAIFLGWLVGSLGLHRPLDVWSKEQIIVGANTGLLGVTLATVILPYYTGGLGNLTVFLAVRFVYGLLMNTKPVQLMYVLESVGAAASNRALVVECVLYSIITIALAASCGWVTYFLDWRLEMLLWCALPQLLGLFTAFPSSWEILRSVPITWRTAVRAPAGAGAKVPELRSEPLEPTVRRQTIALAVCFIACGCGFYGLSYSAGQLGPNVYLSSILLALPDIVGYLAVLTAEWVGKKKLQRLGHFRCAFSSSFVVLFAMLGRLGLDVCFLTIYGLLAEIFTPMAQATALPTCETSARVGTLLAPFFGTLPSAVSCSMFALMCFSAACTTMVLPDVRNDTY